MLDFQQGIFQVYGLPFFLLQKGHNHTMSCFNYGSKISKYREVVWIMLWSCLLLEHMFHCTCSMGYFRTDVSEMLLWTLSLFWGFSASFVCPLLLGVEHTVYIQTYCRNERDIHLQRDAHRYSSPNSYDKHLKISWGFWECLIRQTQHFQRGHQYGPCFKQELQTFQNHSDFYS